MCRGGAEDNALRKLLRFAPGRALETLIFTTIIDLVLLPASISFNTYRMLVMVNLIVQAQLLVDA